MYYCTVQVSAILPLLQVDQSALSLISVMHQYWKQTWNENVRQNIITKINKNNYTTVEPVYSEHLWAIQLWSL